MNSEMLTAEQELMLVRQLPSKRALDTLVLRNTGLVHKVCHKFPLKNAVCTYDDLFQEGIAGLIHGIQKFDPSRGYRLSTYTYRWVQAYVSRFWQNHGKVIRVPVHLSDSSRRMNKEVEQLTKDMGRMPTSTECEQHIAGYNDMMLATRDVFSLNAVMCEDGELMDLAGEDQTEENDTIMDCDALLEELRTMVSDRDYNILCMRYGLNGHPEHTLSEISSHYSITRARCHQIQRECLDHLRTLQPA